MSAINVPANKNFLSPLGFRFILNRAPNLNFHVQAVTVPGLNLSYAETPTPFVPLPNSGKITHGDFNVTFRVSEDLDDYLEIHNWMIGLGATDNFDQYKTVQDQNGKTYSDATVLIMNSSMRANIRVVFKDVFPIQLSDLTFNTTDTDVNYIECSASFKFTKYDIELMS